MSENLTSPEAMSGIRDSEGTLWKLAKGHARIPREPSGFDAELSAFKLDGTELPIEGVLTRATPSLPADRYRFGADGSAWRWDTRSRKGQWKRIAGRTYKGMGTVATFTIGGRGKSQYIGALVLEAFGLQRPNGHECGYKDGNGANCCLSNLQWQPRNSDQGRRRKNTGGDQHHKSVLTSRNVKLAREIHHREGVSASELARRFGVSRNAMLSALKGITWPNAGGPICYNGQRCQRKANHKLSPSDLVQVRNWITAGVSDTEIAQRKDVCRVTIWKIRIGRTYKDV